MVTTQSQAQLSHEMESSPMIALQNQIHTPIQENEPQRKHYDEELATLRAQH